MGLSPCPSPSPWGCPRVLGLPVLLSRRGQGRGPCGCPPGGKLHPRGARLCAPEGRGSLQGPQDLPQFWCGSISAGHRCSPAPWHCPGFTLGAWDTIPAGKNWGWLQTAAEFLPFCALRGPCVGVELKSRPSSGAGNLKLVWEMRACRLLASAELINITRRN